MQYAELLCKTSYSFLRGSSHPQQYIERAAELGISALAIGDRNGVYGLPKAFRASLKNPGLKLISGAELVIFEPDFRVTLLAQNRAGYGSLCRILSLAHEAPIEGPPREAEEIGVRWEQFLQFADSKDSADWIALVSPESLERGTETEQIWGRLKDLFQDRIYSPLFQLLDGMDARRTETALALEKRFGILSIASNDVHYHDESKQALHDVMTAIRHQTTLEEIGKRVFSNSERYLKSPPEMARLFGDLPGTLKNAMSRTLEIAERCTFKLNELRYTYPSEWIPAGETSEAYLSRLVKEGSQKRYPQGVPEAVRKQLDHELRLIHELNFQDYFLTIWEIVEFARSKDILCQGRGSAANSAVCYCLGITAIDPIKMDLLFERFISAERGEPPDIDVDFEHERREEVIQHIYEKYGRDRASLAATHICYRGRLARREVNKVFGLDPETRPETNPLVDQMVEELRNNPRHLSIHPGGFTLSAQPINEIVPIQRGRMDKRTIIQWDKEDLDILGLLKVDILALGMLTALHKALKLVGKYELYTVPHDDPATYAMIQRSDTVGVFQIESRAQISMLPRLLPKNFYDLVVEIAIVRPGPIQGGMVHPYLRRRRGLEPIDLPHPKLESILAKTMGVPIFQEQVMKIAVSLGGFTPGESDELRRAIGAWRSSGDIHRMGKKLIEGLLKSGLSMEFAQRIYQQIQGFAEYGFPESHSASFALLAYASSYLKCHHPAEFTCSLVNSQPLGFYSNHTLLDDARRHGVAILPIHPNISEWDCTIEDGAIRLGWRCVHGLSEAHAQEMIQKRNTQPFQSLSDFMWRAPIRKDVLQRAAMAGIFECFGFDQRHALWRVLEHQLIQSSKDEAQPELFPQLETYEAIQQDYNCFGASTRGHPMQALREKLKRRIPQISNIEIKSQPGGRWIKIAGMIIVRQHPQTAKGTVFATLEDQTGFLDLILSKETVEKFWEVFTENAFFIVQGVTQRDGDAFSVSVRHLAPIGIEEVRAPSRDFK